MGTEIISKLSINTSAQRTTGNFGKGNYKIDYKTQRNIV